MLLSDIFEYLTYGELSQLDLGGAEDGSVEESNYPKLISHINMGLIELYKRFPIRKRKLQIQLDTTLTLYPLRLAYAQSNDASAEPIKFILDTAGDPFTQDVLQVERVTDPDLVDLPLNVLDNELSLFTPEHNVIEVPVPTDIILTVDYRAYPDKIIAANIDPSTEEILLPESLLEAMLLYVAHRTYSPVKAEEGVSYYTRFIAACNTAKELGLVQKLETLNTKLDNNGFV